MSSNYLSFINKLLVETLDKELNEKFNLACEQAFAPCRLFYGEQEKLRAQHLITRNKVLEQAKNLAETLKITNDENASIDIKNLDGQLNKLQQRWQQAGEVDRQQYQKLFEMEDCELEFREEALHAVAQRAMERKTGARGLRSILEKVLLDTMYDLPALSGVSKVIIDADVINEKSKPLLIYEGGEQHRAVSD